MPEAFIGAGWDFPVHTDATGGIALVTGQQEIDSSIRLILGTAYGDRPMRPEFGCAIHDYVFAPADATFAGIVAAEVRASLVRWEPRIDVVDVVATLDPEQHNVVYISITYTLRATNDPRNLVFPFYFIPEE